jgi:hypothetical protein
MLGGSRGQNHVPDRRDTKQRQCRKGGPGGVRELQPYGRNAPTHSGSRSRNRKPRCGHDGRNQPTHRRDNNRHPRRPNTSRDLPRLDGGDPRGSYRRLWVLKPISGARSFAPVSRSMRSDGLGPSVSNISSNRPSIGSGRLRRVRQNQRMIKHSESITGEGPTPRADTPQLKGE